MKKKHHPVIWVSSLFPLIFVVGCENKEMIAQRDAQQLELMELEAHVAKLQREAGERVPDKSGELEDTLAQLDDTMAEIKTLQAESEDLAAIHAEEEKALNEFKARYPIRN